MALMWDRRSWHGQNGNLSHSHDAFGGGTQKSPLENPLAAHVQYDHVHAAIVREAEDFLIRLAIANNHFDGHASGVFTRKKLIETTSHFFHSLGRFNREMGRGSIHHV